MDSIKELSNRILDEEIKKFLRTHRQEVLKRAEKRLKKELKKLGQTK